MILKTWISPFSFALAIVCGQAMPANAQEPQVAAQPTAEDKQKEKTDREKKAFLLLDQIVDDAQLLKLPENRVSLQIIAADVLWDSNQARARTLFAGAADAIAEMMRNADQSQQRRGPNQSRTGAQLRQELVLSAARHDAPLAYQLLSATRAAVPSTTDGSNSPRVNSEENLEQMLLARIAALDPKMALQNAEQLLEKGQFPRTLVNVLAELQRKDKEAAAKLEEKMFKRLQSANMLASQEAGGLALSLLRPGPRISDSSMTASSAPPNNQPQLMGQSTYVDLLGTVIDAALKATPQAAGGNQRGQNRRGRFGSGPGGGQSNTGGGASDAQIEQTNARRLLSGLQLLLPQIDQYLPSRGSAVREKMTELGMAGAGDMRATQAQLFNLMRQGSADNLLNAAPTAPAQMQSRIYQQAALKALDEGNPDRARQIANDHLETPTRDRVLQQVEFQQLSDKTEATRLNELRQTLAGLRSDEARVDLLMQLASAAGQKNPKLAVQLLEQAKQLTSRRATNYQQFEQQLAVAAAFKELEPSRSFEVLEPGIAQLNELLSAAATLSGFEVNVFREGELPLQSRNNLSGMVTRYGQALGALAESDFDRAEALANRFQLVEPRILVRIAIVQGLLGNQAARSQGSDFNFRDRGPDAFVRPPE